MERTRRHSILFLVATAAMLLPAYGCTSQKDDQHGKKDDPHGKTRVESFHSGLMFLDPQHQTSGSVSHQFLYRNTSHRTIRLKVQKTCTCTEAHPAKDVLSPGASTQFTFTYPLRYTREIAKQFALVSAEDDSVAPIKYEIVADVYPRVLVIPEHPGIFAVRPGDSVDSQYGVIVFQDAREPELPIAIASDCKELTITGVSHPVSRIESGARRTEWLCQTRLSPPILTASAQPAEPETAERNITVTHGHSRYQYLVRWRYLLPIHIVPPQLFLQPGRETGKGSAVSRFDLQCDTSFCVERIELSVAGSSPITLSDKRTVPRQTHTIVVCLPDRLKIDYRKEAVLRFVTSHPKAPIVSVPLYSF